MDRMYHWIESVAQDILRDSVVIYRFWPHGSKNINHMTPLDQQIWSKVIASPAMYCNDQEPLNYNYYNSVRRNSPGHLLPNFLHDKFTVYQKTLLLHSEQHSANVDQYETNHFVPVYWWCHAVMALDWFRFARHVKLQSQPKKTFLVYNRAWSGTREYRLKFAELLIQHDLVPHCQTSVSFVEPELGVHYGQHEFANLAWQPACKLEHSFESNQFASHASADFDIADYNGTHIEVILETLFDDDRIQLTEKSLRPMAMAQPFIVASTANSLEYLRSYGFRTFGHIWDESYDHIVDPPLRLRAIAQLMADIANWSASTRAEKMAQAKQIAEHNRKHFFSDQFYNLVCEELRTNLTAALIDVEFSKDYQQWHRGLQAFMAKPGVLTQLGSEIDCTNTTLLSAIQQAIGTHILSSDAQIQSAQINTADFKRLD